MDRRMPIMDGMEATKAIRQLPRGKDVKIVAVTASAMKEQYNEMIQLGMDDVVRKPYRFNEIYDCLTKLLGIEFIREDAQKSEGHSAKLTPEMLAVLPDTIRTELKSALESLYSDRIEAVIEEIKPRDLQLYKILAHLVDNFDYPTILNALEQLNT